MVLSIHRSEAAAAADGGGVCDGSGGPDGAASPSLLDFAQDFCAAARAATHTPLRSLSEEVAELDA